MALTAIFINQKSNRVKGIWPSEAAQEEPRQQGNLRDVWTQIMLVQHTVSTT